MFIPKLYRNENRKEIIDFIKKNNFGILISKNISNKIIATHIPFTCYENKDNFIIASHISKANEQWKYLEQNQEVLVIFLGAHSYISSSWYDHINVPTWDYIAVHLYGQSRILNHNETLEHLNQLVNQHEVHEKNPVSLESMTSKYVEKEMKGLVAFEIKVEEMFSAFKLSQNRDVKNLESIIQELEARKDENSMAIATELKKIKMKKES